MTIPCIPVSVHLLEEVYPEVTHSIFWEATVGEQEINGKELK